MTQYIQKKENVLGFPPPLNRVVLNSLLPPPGPQLLVRRNWGSGPSLTFAVCMEFDDYEGFQHIYEGHFTLSTSGGNLQFFDDNIGGIAAPLPSVGTRIAIMLTIDYSGGIDGTKTLSIVMNGQEVITSTDGVGSFTFVEDQWAYFFSNGGGSYPQGRAVEQVWAQQTSTPLQPAAHYATFFDGNNDPKVLPSANGVKGVVGGVEPRLFIKGGAEAWNSETDQNGNAVESGGTFVDVPQTDLNVDQTG